jgi:hypothetical protein
VSDERLRELATNGECRVERSRGILGYICDTPTPDRTQLGWREVKEVEAIES